MPTQLQLNIQDTIQQIVHLKRVEEQLLTTKDELDQAYAEQNKLDKVLRKELKDIAKLEGLSTKAIFYKILGSKEKQLEKERQEYLELSLKEEDIKKSIELLEYEENILEAKVGNRSSLEKELEGLKVRREEEIILSDPSLRAKLLQLSDEIEGRYAFKTELEEAYEVAGVCHNLIQQIVTHLSRVRSWGSWQSGGQRRSTMSQMRRRDAMDRARNISYQVKHHLNLLDRELRDIGKQVNFSVDISKLSNFSDFFFNNLITDWIVNQQLTTAISSAVALRDNLGRLLSDLKLEKDQVVANVNQLSEARDKILIS